MLFANRLERVTVNALELLHILAILEHRLGAESDTHLSKQKF